MQIDVAGVGVGATALVLFFLLGAWLVLATIARQRQKWLMQAFERQSREMATMAKSIERLEARLAETGQGRNVIRRARAAALDSPKPFRYTPRFPEVSVERRAEKPVRRVVHESDRPTRQRRDRTGRGRQENPALPTG